jgi:chemotaxis protein methyltransferase WspC
VHFRQGNLLDKRLFPEKSTYDCIYCRNLLIYFDHPTRQVALGILGTLLKAGGVMFVGAAEVPLVEEHGFESLGIPLAFACRKRVAGVVGRRRTGEPEKSGSNGPERAIGRIPAATWMGDRPASQPGSQDQYLALAKRLVDNGRPAEAKAICEEAIRHSPTCAQAYFLLGLIRDAAGSPDALECYRKALYLQPGHYDCLVRMATQARKSGRQDQERNYQMRAHRARQGCIKPLQETNQTRGGDVSPPESGLLTKGDETSPPLTTELNAARRARHRHTRNA